MLRSVVGSMRERGNKRTTKNNVACFPGNATSNSWVTDLITRFICKSDRINLHHNKDFRFNVFMISLYFSTTCFGLIRTIIM
jgi:hypothetical protein